MWVKWCSAKDGTHCHIACYCMGLIDRWYRMVIGVAGYWTELYYAIAWNWTVLYDITWYFPILCGIAWYRIFFIVDKNCISNLFTNSKVASMDIRTAGELYQLFNFTKNPSRSHLKVGKYQDHSYIMSVNAILT